RSQGSGKRHAKSGIGSSANRDTFRTAKKAGFFRETKGVTARRPAKITHTNSRRTKISWEVPAPFPMDLIVRTPKNLGWRLAEGESFHTEIVKLGKVLYETGDSRVGGQGRKRSARSP